MVRKLISWNPWNRGRKAQRRTSTRRTAGRNPLRNIGLGIEQLESRVVLSADPILSIESNQFFAVGGSLTLFRASFTDIEDGTNMGYDYTIDWGDGSPVTTGNTVRFQPGYQSLLGEDAPIFGVLDAFHAYASAGQYTVTVTLTDGTGFDTEQTVVNVYERDDGLRFDGNFADVNEGESFEFSLIDTVNDPSAPDPIVGNIESWIINWGDSIEVIDANPTSVTHTYGDNDMLHDPVNGFPGVRAISVAAVGSNGTYFAWSGGLKTVNDVPAIVNVVGASDVNEGEDYTLDLSAIDPGDPVDAWIVLWSMEDPLEGMSIIEGNNLTVSHTYADGNFTHTVFAVAVSGNEQLGFGTLSVNVHNVAPNADAGGPYTVDEGGSVILSAAGTTGSTSDIGGALYEWDLDNDGDFDDATGISHVFDATGLDGDGSLIYTINLRVTDEDGESDVTSTTVEVVNAAPTAVLSGGGTVNEGSSATVSFSGQTDPSAADTSAGFRYAYDFNNDGIWDLGDGTYTGSLSSDSAAVPGSFLADGDATYTIKARIVDKDGGFSDYSTTIDVVNVDPTANAGGPYFTFDDTPITLSGSGSDVAGIHDPLTFEWDLDNDGQFDDAAGANATFDPQALGFTGTQTRTVNLRVTDGDGGQAIATTTVELLGVGTALIDGVLHVVGSNNSDIALVSKLGSNIIVIATFNDDNPVSFAASSITEIQVRTRGGSDIVITTPNVTHLMTIDGGGGNDLLVGGGGRNVIHGGLGHDVIHGGSGDDVLLGEDGNDDIFGGSGNDVLVGGNGNDILDGGTDRDVLIGSQDEDTLRGGNDDDILIGGFTAHDNNISALDAMMAIWGSSASFTSRVATLTASGGLLEPGVAVFDDDDDDRIIGAAGRDLIFADTYQWDGAVDNVTLQAAQDVLVAVN